MKIENYQFPKSSFLSLEKDLEIITNNILKNDRLKRLLYYTSPDALAKNNLSEKEVVELCRDNIKILPKINIDGSVLNYLVIGFNNFFPNAKNPEFRDNTITFDIICHIDQWPLQGFQLRPFKIAAEIDYMFNDKHLSGIGKLQFMGGSVNTINEDYFGVTLAYKTIHGEEDKKNLPNPIDNDNFIEEFNRTWNV